MERTQSSVHPMKRILCLALAFVLLLGMVPVTARAAEGTTLYLKPNDNWLEANARFAVYSWEGSDSAWNSMTGPDENGIYEGTVPAGHTNIIFCRMNPDAAANDWNNKWNQTADLTVPTDGGNLYTLNAGDWNGGGVWSIYGEEPEEPSSEVEESSSEAGGDEEALYIVAGVAALCGSEWNAADTANRMHLMEDGTYTITYADVAPGTYSLKVTDGTWNNSWGDNGQNYTFEVSVACDVTVTFDPDAYTVHATGDGVGLVTELEITSINAVGNGSGNWLNGASWNTAANAMTETSEKVYEITFEDVPAGTGYQFKFAANGSWTDSWGGGGAEGEAVYNGQNISLSIEYALADVTLKLDLSGYDHGSKSGATYSATVTEAVAEPTVDYYLVGYINGADYGCNDDWENLGEYKFENGKLAAKFDVDSYVFVKTGDNSGWYMFETYVSTTSGTLYPSSDTICEKMMVPGGVEVEFTLTENEDGTLTLSYATQTTEPEEPVVDYYLIGSINGANYGCEEDYENLGEYKFVDGKLTAKFDSDSYVFVKTGDNLGWFMTNGWLGTEVTSATLYNTNNNASFPDGTNKLYVPGGVEYIFTLAENEDGSLTLSYAEKPDTTDVTLHFFKTEGWGNTINAYLWISGAVPGYEDYNTWPGKAVSANSQHPGWYDLVVSLETPMAFNFIFNDGGNQTADLYTGDVTGDTELWVVGNNVMSTAPGEWSGDYDYTANLYFQKPEGWADSIHAYLWTDAETISAPWPGDAAEADAINGGWYSYTVTMDENEGFNFIFNDGTNQTGNLTTGTLDVKTDLWIVDGIVLTEAPAGWRNPNRTIHVPGTFPGPSWDAASNQMTWDAELGLYVYTFENVPAANYEYKIAVNGSWNENYGAGGVRDGANMAVAVTETTDVTVYYNDETHNSVTSISYVFADATLSGTGIPEGTKLTDKGLTGIYSVTVPMTAGTYTDLVITCNGTEYAFAEVEVKGDKDVTFFLDPITGIFYCNASPVPVNAEAIYFDSQDETYKQPFGAVATGEDVTFSIDTGADIINAVLVVKGIGSWPMTVEETETGKRWSATTSFSAIGEYDYYFSLSNGSTVAIYSDDDGYYGEGMVTELTDAKPYDLVVYKAGFKTPDWMKDAVIYQIFPDRFFDGDVSNNQAQTWARGDVNYEYITDWYTLPENPEQKAMLDEATYKSTGAHYGDGEWSNEIYGGDLEGITERIGYLKALGVNVIYLNPIFWSISNHRYDAVDYMEIDPVLGTLGDFEELVKIAEKNDMHIILDGVFNHVSDDSVYFDRYYKFLGTSNKIGAYPYWAYVYDYMAANSVDMAAAEAAAKAYFSTEYGITDWSYTTWFAVSSKTMAGTVDDIGLRAGKEVYSYEGWWGYDSMPVIKSTNGSEYQTGNWAQEIICNAGETSVTQYWITKGNNGWRLDVANEVSDETWQRFRDSVKALDSDAVIIGEIWDDATKYLKGDMYDSVMNYLFRNAATSFAMGSDAAETMMQLEKIRERYPEEAFYAMMNLVGSHDTTRLLSYLDGIADDRSQKDLASAFPTYEATSPEAKQMQHLVAFLQFTYAGAPTIYYGDEIGMVGSDDPDDRRAMEWGQGSKELVEWYAKLAAIRAAYPALRTGTVEPLELENTYDLLAFVRRDEANTVTVIANNAFNTVDVQLEGTYIDLVTGKTFNGTVPACGGVILVAEDEVKTISVNYAGLAPAYDPAYTVAERPEGVHVHKYEAVVTDPTCTEEGFTTYTCDLCGDSYTGDPIPTVPHAETAAITAPTCTEEGFTTYTCDLCGTSRTDDFVDALGHSYSYTDSENIRTYTCDTCGDSYESKVILLASGKSKTLKFIHPVTGKTVSGSKVNWKIEDIFAVNPYEYEEDMGEYKAPIDPKYFSAYATIKDGKLKTNKNGDRISILITASLKSDPAITNSYCIELAPAATNVHVRMDDGDGMKYVSNSTRTWDVSDSKTLSLSALVYPFNARQDVKWSVSNSKIASVDQNGLLTFTGKKFGKLTVTATARDGSKVKSSVTLNVIRTVQNMELPAAMVTTAGKTVKLASKLTFDPKPTVKSIRWSMQMAKFAEDGSRTLVDVPSSVATLNAKTGDLKVSKKLSGYAYLYVTAYDSKSGVSAETEVYLCPKAMTGIVVKNLNGKTIKSGSTVTVTDATDFRFTVAPKNSTAKTYHDWIGLLAFSAKTSDEDIAVIETNAEMTEVSVVQTSEAGKVKVTIKAKDGSGKSFSFYVNFKNAPVTAE